MPNLDEIGKKVFEDETPKATKGALIFRRDPTSSVQSAESDGLLLASSLGTDLSSLPAPWCYFPKDQPEVLIELKMRGDHTSPLEIHRALLQREAWEFSKREKASKAGKTYDHEIPIWFVSAHLPQWLQAKVLFRKRAEGCYHSRTPFYELNWIVSNELPKEEALIPFLMTRDGEALEDFFTWVAKVRTRSWVLPVLKVFRMNKEFIQEVIRLSGPETDPEQRAYWAEIAKGLLDQDPELKAEIEGEAARIAKQAGKAEGATEALKHMLELKLGRAVTTQEEERFTAELKRIGTDGISQLLFASDKKSLSAWLSPKATTKKPTKAKK